jgi:hypothetical protein
MSFQCTLEIARLPVPDFNCSIVAAGCKNRDDRVKGESSDLITVATKGMSCVPWDPVLDRRTRPLAGCGGEILLQFADLFLQI